MIKENVFNCVIIHQTYEQYLINNHFLIFKILVLMINIINIKDRNYNKNMI